MNHDELIPVSVKLLPPLGYTGMHIAGIPLADIVTLLTLLYVVLQLFLLIPKLTDWYRSWRQKCRSKQDSPKQE
jgi:antibiotic biosynthesis monooxygenase (ABM) superfamily enzyme